MSQNIVFLDAITLGNTCLDPLRRCGNLTTYNTTSKDQIAERISGAQIVITNKVILGKSEINSAPALKLICVAATGTNNIDIAYAKSKGIEVRNVENYSTASVAQCTWAHILNLMNRTPYFDSRVKDGTYSASGIFTDSTASFCELAGETVGIIGMGKIGQKVAAIATAFGMEVIYFPTSGIAHCNQYTAVSLDDLLRRSLIVSVHAPLSEKTFNLINKDNMHLMRQDAIIVNTGRGGIVNQNDLANAIDANTISGAALDVFEVEPLAADSPLLTLKHKDRLSLSPHIAWASAQAKERLVHGIANNIIDFIEGA